MVIDPSQIFMDERLHLEVCVYCGGEPETREHIPPKIFLDRPYPNGLPIVPACKQCNNSKSINEEYLACLLECIVCGTTNADGLERDKIKKALSHSPRLKTKLENAKNNDDGELIWDVEHDRVQALAVQLAQGHIAYEEVAMWDEPSDIYISPLHTMPTEIEYLFSEHADCGGFSVYPELGSRAFLRLFDTNSDFVGSWIEVQKGRYRYKVTQDPAVLIIIREYLGIYVSWEQ